MQQLFFIKKGKLEWREVNSVKIENANQSIVRPFAVSKCDLDNAFLFSDINFKLSIGNKLGLVDKDFFKYFGANFFKGPFPFGHECVAEIVEVGENVKNFKVGDVVSMPFQISCGHCSNCNNGITSSCESTPSISTYGFGKHLEFGGAMSDFLQVPFADAMLLKIPAHINPIHLASLGDNVSDAYKNIGPELEKNPNQTILIIGGKAESIAQYSILIAKSMKALQVDFVDKNNNNLELAQRNGADNVFNSFSEIKNKYDIVVDASSNEKGLAMAFEFVKPYGICVSSGIYLKKTKLPLVKMYAKGITFKTGLTNVKSASEKVLDLIVNNNLDLSKVTVSLNSWENASEAFLSTTSKVIVTRDKIFN